MSRELFLRRKRGSSGEKLSKRNLGSAATNDRSIGAHEHVRVKCRVKLNVAPQIFHLFKLCFRNDVNCGAPMGDDFIEKLVPNCDG